MNEWKLYLIDDNYLNKWIITAFKLYLKEHFYLHCVNTDT